MTMTPDVIAMIIALFAFMATIIGVVIGVQARFAKSLDARFAQIDARFDRVDTRFDRVDARFDKIDARLGNVEHELVEVKVAIARLEGPRPQLHRL